MPLPLVSAKVLKTRPIGMTSDYCPVCRAERRFRLALAQNHIYVALVDRGTRGSDHHELTCTSCGCRLERPSEERPVEHIPGPGAAENYEPPTLPIVRTRIDDCLAMDAARRENRLRPEQREELIRHAMFCFARLYDEEPFERMTPLTKLLVLLVCVVFAGAGFWLTRTSGSAWWLAGAGLLIATVLAALVNWSHRTSPRRRVRGWLARALAPLDPTREEIRRVRAELQKSRIGAGFTIRSDKVLYAIRKIRAREGRDAHPSRTSM